MSETHDCRSVLSKVGCSMYCTVLYCRCSSVLEVRVVRIVSYCIIQHWKKASSGLFGLLVGNLVDGCAFVSGFVMVNTP